MVKFRFQLFSDIHCELTKNIPKIPNLAPYLFLAGDIGKINTNNFTEFIEYANKNWEKVFYVCGNHEYYHASKTHVEINQMYKKLFVNYSNIIFLDDSHYKLNITNQLNTNNQIKIYGSTLWSNVTQTNKLNDFNMIKMKNEKNWTVPINEKYFNQLHFNSLKQLVNTVKESAITNEKLIIITHFPPIKKINGTNNTTSHVKFQSQPEYLANYFANDLIGLNLDTYGINETDFYSNINLWISGHTHYSYDFTYNKTRFLSNQIGYIGEQNMSNPKYDGVFEIDL